MKFSMFRAWISLHQGVAGITGNNSCFTMYHILHFLNFIRPQGRITLLVAFYYLVVWGKVTKEENSIVHCTLIQWTLHKQRDGDNSLFSDQTSHQCFLLYCTSDDFPFERKKTILLYIRYPHRLFSVVVNSLLKIREHFFRTLEQDCLTVTKSVVMTTF